jgi:hypothetical protein
MFATVAQFAQTLVFEMPSPILIIKQLLIHIQQRYQLWVLHIQVTSSKAFL